MLKSGIQILLSQCRFKFHTVWLVILKWVSYSNIFFSHSTKWKYYKYSFHFPPEAFSKSNLVSNKQWLFTIWFVFCLLIHQKTLIMCQMLSGMDTFKITFSGRLQDFLMRLYFLEKAKSIFLMQVGIKYFFVKECFHHVYPQTNGKIMQSSTNRICSINLPTFSSKLGTCHFLKIFAGQLLFNTLKIKCRKTSSIN